MSLSVRARVIGRALVAAFSIGGASPANAAAPEFGPPWPHTWEEGGLTLMLYQPEAMRWEGDSLSLEAPVAVKQGERTSYGVLDLQARTEIDEGSGTVHLRDVQVARARFPGAPGQARVWKPLLERRIPERYDAPRAQLDDAIATSRAQKAHARDVRNEPPVLVFRTGPALLVQVDGAPRLAPVEGTSLRRVVNTRPLLLEDPASGRYYLRLLDGWMESPGLDRPWGVAKEVPGELEKARAWAASQGGIDLLEAKAAPEGSPPGGAEAKPPSLTAGAPEIVVATRPTELIVTDGAPQLGTVEGTRLLYWKNTGSDVLVDSSSGLSYVRAAGRWFRASSLDGPWSWVPPKELPPDLARIPPGSPKEGVLASVPGTPQSRESLIANSIPQTATVKRADARLETTTDGAPELRPIAGTPLSYVANSATPIIQVDPTSWYAVRDGVWFTSSSPSGPWFVATSVPAVIYTIPPGSPLHYVTYVRVYGSTPEVVYVGYTPGYMGTFVAPGGIVVYGTGWAYQPWIGTVWYGPPLTYGFGMRVVWTSGWGWGLAPVYAWRPAGWWWGFGVGPYWGGAVLYRPVWYPVAVSAYGYHPVAPAPPLVARAGVYGRWSATTVQPAPHPAAPAPGAMSGRSPPAPALRQTAAAARPSAQGPARAGPRPGPAQRATPTAVPPHARKRRGK